jgi:hypothetical protein
VAYPTAIARQVGVTYSCTLCLAGGEFCERRGVYEQSPYAEPVKFWKRWKCKCTIRKKPPKCVCNRHFTSPRWRSCADTMLHHIGASSVAKKRQEQRAIFTISSHPHLQLRPPLHSCLPHSSRCVYLRFDNQTAVFILRCSVSPLHLTFAVNIIHPSQQLPRPYLRRTIKDIIAHSVETKHQETNRHRRAHSIAQTKGRPLSQL